MKTIFKIILLSLSLLLLMQLFSFCLCCGGKCGVKPPARVLTGADILLAERLGELAERRIGLVVNHSARVGGRHLVDALLEEGIDIAAIFAPEHGFRGDAGAGERIDDASDPASGIPIYSLYGDTRKPSPEMLAGLDLLIFDIQDVGARCYTYIATLGLVIEAAGEAGIPIMILDRPNPAGGEYIGGWLMEERFMSFVGPYPIPMAHGLTIGEMARMIVGERWVEYARKPEIIVVEMEGWRRGMKWPDTGLEWIAPSPNLPHFDNAFLYLGTVLFEGSSLSEGRGTESPFLILGDPDTVIADRHLHELQNISPSLQIEAFAFTPVSIPNAAPQPKHEDSPCRGIRIRLLNCDFDPVVAGLRIFKTMLDATPGHDLNESLYRLAGTERINAVLAGTAEPGRPDFKLENYLARRKLYLLY